MRLCKSSHLRWPLLWWRTLGEILAFHLGLYSSWSLKGSVLRLWERVSFAYWQSNLWLGDGAAYRQQWEDWEVHAGQHGDLLLGWGINLQLCAGILWAIALQGHKWGLSSIYDHGCLSGCFSGRVIRFHRVSVWNVIHSFIIRISVAFSEQLTFRPLNGEYFRMDHVWGKLWIMTAIPEKAERRISDWKLILVILHMLTLSHSSVSLLSPNRLLMWQAVPDSIYGHLLDALPRMLWKNLALPFGTNDLWERRVSFHCQKSVNKCQGFWNSCVSSCQHTVCKRKTL